MFEIELDIFLKLNLALKIHISENYKKNLDQHAEFIIEPRDTLTYIKGIGNMQTYFLKGIGKKVKNIYLL